MVVTCNPQLPPCIKEETMKKYIGDSTWTDFVVRDSKRLFGVV